MATRLAYPEAQTHPRRRIAGDLRRDARGRRGLPLRCRVGTVAVAARLPGIHAGLGCVAGASGRQDDAPEAVLDEFEIDQRNGARSIGFAVMQSLGLIAACYLIFGAVITNGDNGDMVYAGGIFTLMAVLIGGCTPAMILAWTRPDPDVDDIS